MVKRVLTPEVEREIITDYMSGVKIREITEKYGIGVGTLYRILEKHGVDVRRRRRGSYYYDLMREVIRIIAEHGRAHTSHIINELIRKYGERYRLTRIRARSLIHFTARKGLIRRDESGVYWELTREGCEVAKELGMKTPSYCGGGGE